MKLTDTYLVILAAAAKRNDRGAKLPSRLSSADAEKVVAKLAGAGLLEEVETSGELPVWRTVEGQRYSLRVTDKGLDAIGVELRSKPAGPRNANQNRGNGAKQSSRTSTKVKSAKKPTRKPSQRRTNKQHRGKGMPKPPVHRSGTKLATVMDLLSRKQGATVDEMVKATGWQAHSVRGAISGTVKKKLGCMVTSEKRGDVRRYRVGTGSRS